MIRFDADELRLLARDARAAGPAAARGLKGGVRAAGEIVAADARSRAGWSSRIPGSVTVRSSVRAAVVEAGGDTAPHAAPYENEGRPGTFRHPVNAWARRDRAEWVWADNPARPFLHPALMARADEVADVIAAAVVESGLGVV